MAGCSVRKKSTEELRADLKRLEQLGALGALSPAKAKTLTLTREELRTRED